MINDPIADMLTRIRNANQRRFKTVEIPYSKIKNELVKILIDEGYIADFKIKNQDKVAEKSISVTLKYKGQRRVINGLKRISKPGLRVYSSSEKLPKVLNGFGIAIISTSNGIMTSEEARKKKLGGEVLAFVW